MDPEPPTHVVLEGEAPGIVAYAQADLDRLLAQLADPARWRRRGGRWRPRLDDHHCHLDAAAGLLKAYVDQPSRGTGSRWRLYFEARREGPALVVRLARCRRDH